MSGPKILITGSSSGIGLACAHLLAPNFSLGLSARNPHRLEAAHASLPRPSAHTVFAGDITEHTGDLVSWADDDLYAVIHSAGVAPLGQIGQLQPGDLESTFAVNTIAPIQLTSALLPSLRAGSGGRVVFMNSGAGLHSNPSWGAYAASKFAVRSLADALRKEEPRLGVSSIFPGRVATPMQRSVNEQEKAPYLPENYLQPEQVAQLVVSELLRPREDMQENIVLYPGASPVRIPST